MDKEKNDLDINNNSSDEGFKEYTTGKFYEELYNDLPKEVVELLMKTHPLMCKDENEEVEGLAVESTSQTKLNRQQETETIRRIRSEQKVTEQNKNAKNTEKIEAIDPIEVDNIKDEPTFEDDKQKILKIAKAAREEIAKKEKSVNNTNKNVTGFEDEEDLIQLVKMKGNHPKKQPRNINKSKAANSTHENKTQSEVNNIENMDTSSKNKKGTNKPNSNKNTEGVLKGSMGNQHTDKKNNNFDKENMNLDKINKEATLDKFFREDGMYEDDEKQFNLPEGRKIVIACLVLGICLIGFLSFKTVSLTGKLAKANEDLTAFSTLKDEHSQLKLEKYAIEEELINLKNGSEPAPNVLAPDGTKVSDADSNKAGDKTQTGKTDTYTVVEGDSYWSISSKVYGNGAEYKKILDANGLKEDTLLSLGQQLKIPR